MNKAKEAVYKSILFSEELQNDEICHIVIVQPTSLRMDFNSQIGFHNIKKEKDSVSILNLRNSLSENYRVYSIEDKLSNTVQGYELVSQLQRMDSLYAKRNLQKDICDSSFDVIKIQEPLDSWMKIYKANILLNKANVVIPVIYESFMEKPKYLLYKIELYEGSTKVKSMKVVELD
ncbi:hypothetical protein GFU95_06715 [Apibacter sp. B3889]|uniref:hypothetical protein n=1 Tax=unclassified Apibacter TaxID=2630820 RepID=UPI0013239523|nr:MULTISPECIES: hypothetical protein [unclassified Apibacter]MXO34837.1 hypothetical protein [Apibacter sp. B3883]MXO42059.1 hypothetical protein [Apibacter sp. B3889]MXP03629.1 hypothetical protein [Apibacter sp. B3887]MXP08135.1 hypothetical protein [Apibacter sp. B3935]